MFRDRLPYFYPMARKLDHIVLVDIEATCWEGKVPEGMSSDIIEVGVCLLDVNSGERTANRGVDDTWNIAQILWETLHPTPAS